jgi:hypothetical protein
MQFACSARLDRWIEEGIPFFVASDAGNCNDGLNVQKELRAVAGFRTLPCAFDSTMSHFLAGGDAVGALALARIREAGVRARSLLGQPAFLLSTIMEGPGEMHPAFRTGVIAEGALANLAVWNLDHPTFWPATEPMRVLAFGDVTQALEQLFILGRPIAKEGRVLEAIAESSEYKEALGEANRRLAIVCERAGI